MYKNALQKQWEKHEIDEQKEKKSKVYKQSAKYYNNVVWQAMNEKWRAAFEKRKWKKRRGTKEVNGRGGEGRVRDIVFYEQMKTLNKTGLERTNATATSQEWHSTLCISKSFREIQHKRATQTHRMWS